MPTLEGSMVQVCDRSSLIGFSRRDEWTTLTTLRASSRIVVMAMMAIVITLRSYSSMLADHGRWLVGLIKVIIWLQKRLLSKKHGQHFFDSWVNVLSLKCGLGHFICNLAHSRSMESCLRQVRHGDAWIVWSTESIVWPLRQIESFVAVRPHALCYVGWRCHVENSKRPLKQVSRQLLEALIH